jgi:hypothetical protein
LTSLTGENLSKQTGVFKFKDLSANQTPWRISKVHKYHLFCIFRKERKFLLDDKSDVLEAVVHFLFFWFEVFYNNK